MSANSVILDKQSGGLLPGTRPGGSVSASLPMMSEMPQQRGLLSRLSRLARPATYLRQPPGTTIEQEGSRPVAPILTPLPFAAAAMGNKSRGVRPFTLDLSIQDLGSCLFAYSLIVTVHPRFGGCMQHWAAT